MWWCGYVSADGTWSNHIWWLVSGGRLDVWVCEFPIAVIGTKSETSLKNLARALTNAVFGAIPKENPFSAGILRCYSRIENSQPRWGMQPPFSFSRVIVEWGYGLGKCPLPKVYIYTHIAVRFATSNDIFISKYVKCHWMANMHSRTPIHSRTLGLGFSCVQSSEALVCANKWAICVSKEFSSLCALPSYLYSIEWYGQY